MQMIRSLLKSLYWKLAIAFVTLQGVLILAVLGIMLNSVDMYVQEATQKISVPIAQTIVMKANPLVGDHIDWEKLAQIFDSATMLNPGIEIYILGEQGNIRASSISKDLLSLTSIDLDPIHQFIESSDPIFILGSDPRDPQRPKVFSAAKVQNEAGIHYVYVILRGEEYESASKMLQESYILSFSIRAIALTLLMAFGMALLVLWGVTRKLRRLHIGVTAFKEGNYDARVPITSNDELDELAKAFNEMADTTHQHLQSIQKTDQLRRNLVANVSHDLRTPLASIQGYLETLQMKKCQLSDEDMDRYLSLVLNSTHSLTKLVHELFELSKLDAEETEPVFEDFSISELLQDLVMQFQPQCEKKSIRIQTVFPQKSILVHADIGMIERVLRNLMDNALRYTPPIGVMTLSLEQNDHEVQVSISDTGDGIDAEDLEHIFDQFYRGKEHRSRTQQGSGLGLAIAQKIIKLHGQSLEVSSQVGVGTTFSFKLAQTGRH